MKSFVRLTLSTAVLLGAVSTSAAELSKADLAACEAEVRDHYGEEAELRLVKYRPHIGGTRILVAAQVGPDAQDVSRTYLATCWAPDSASFAYDVEEAKGPISDGVEVAATE
jgi:hypothetical protein